MRSNMDIDQLRYRSAALGHAYLMAKEKGVPLKGLPSGILDDLGISVRDGLCTTFDVSAPRGMGAAAILHRMEHFEGEMGRSLPKKGLDTAKKPAKASGKGTKDPSQEAGISDEEDAAVFKTFPCLTEGMAGVLDQFGARIQDKG